MNRVHPNCTERKSLNKSADGRVATGAAWLKGRNSQGGREKQKHPYRKKKRKNRKTHLTHTGLLMEGVGLLLLAADAGNSDKRTAFSEPVRPEEVLRVL